MSRWKTIVGYFRKNDEHREHHYTAATGADAALERLLQIGSRPRSQKEKRRLEELHNDAILAVINTQRAQTRLTNLRSSALVNFMAAVGFIGGYLVSYIERDFAQQKNTVATVMAASGAQNTVPEYLRIPKGAATQYSVQPVPSAAMTVHSAKPIATARSTKQRSVKPANPEAKKRDAFKQNSIRKESNQYAQTSSPLVLSSVGENEQSDYAQPQAPRNAERYRWHIGDNLYDIAKGLLWANYARAGQSDRMPEREEVIEYYNTKIAPLNEFGPYNERHLEKLQEGYHIWLPKLASRKDKEISTPKEQVVLAENYSTGSANVALKIANNSSPDKEPSAYGAETHKTDLQHELRQIAAKNYDLAAKTIDDTIKPDFEKPATLEETVYAHSIKDVDPVNDVFDNKQSDVQEYTMLLLRHAR